MDSEIPCELRRGRINVLGFQPHMPTPGPCWAQEEVGGKMRGFDGTNRPESTQAGGWDREEGPQWSLCGATQLPASGREGGAGVVRNNSKRLFSAL